MALWPRLNDGVFLYEQGLKNRLEHYNEKLKHITFQKELGTVYDKVQRIASHAALLQRRLNISDPAKTKRAAELCKADMASEMVFEFPELQGTIGHYYALAQGEDPEVAQAIEEQWMPRGENAPLPATATGVILSFADKIDNLLGCYTVNLKPTSSSDPYALRRQVLGIIKMIINGQYRLPIMDVLRECIQAFQKVTPAQRDVHLKEIEAFLTNRVKTVFQDYGFSKDEIEAGLTHGFTDIYDAFCKVKALHKFRLSNTKFPLLCEVYKRAKGQLNGQAQTAFKSELLQEQAEKDLDSMLNATQIKFDQAMVRHDYDQAYELIAQIQPALALLFEQVKILADDPKTKDNRIALLQRVFSLFEQLLDFSKIQQA
jgi:glycyl-tRNA synthetase